MNLLTSQTKVCISVGGLINIQLKSAKVSLLRGNVVDEYDKSA